MRRKKQRNPSPCPPMSNKGARRMPVPSLRQQRGPRDRKVAKEAEKGEKYARAEEAGGMGCLRAGPVAWGDPSPSPPLNA